MSLKIVFILANSEDQDEMPQKATFPKGLHCLPKKLYQYPEFKEPSHSDSCFDYPQHSMP